MDGMGTGRACNDYACLRTISVHTHPSTRRDNSGKFFLRAHPWNGRSKLEVAPRPPMLSFYVRFIHHSVVPGTRTSYGSLIDIASATPTSARRRSSRFHVMYSPHSIRPPTPCFPSLQNGSSNNTTAVIINHFTAHHSAHPRILPSIIRPKTLSSVHARAQSLRALLVRSQPHRSRNRGVLLLRRTGEGSDLELEGGVVLAGLAVGALGLVLALRDDKVHVRVHVEADDHFVEGLRQATGLEVEAEEGLLCISR
jgi:hypothetical protein